MRKRELSIVDHLNSSSDDSKAEKDFQEKAAKAIKELSLSRFFDWSQPWVLIPGGSYDGYFDFLPRHLRCGPLSVISISSATITLSAMLMIGMEVYKDGGIMVLFADNMPQNYVAFDRDWYMTLAGFFWMIFICWYVYARGPKASEILRFPALLSATLVFFIWNFVLFPVTLLCIEDREKRNKFLNYMTNFRLSQLHVFNVAYAAINGAFLGPRRSLHMGDVATASIFLTIYMLFYYCVLDRIGVHLYAIFSLRTAWSSVSFALLITLSYAGFHGWQWVLSR
ncbi:unnamed protein product [Cylindrotheca closterium]|uniref:Uncharacterized protein n=1 Tax=Cylindrotheca closterium TaxID=2856 RepID=A0AAD2JKC5_9STRA|nr:unnamed protein product [Cylindrotheca closterium]